MMDGFYRKDDNNYQLNVFGKKLVSCSCRTKNKLTGFFRDGFCNTNEHDLGLHTVCSIMTQSFLDFSKSVGNDLITPRPEYDFKGLIAGDEWCICANRWKEAYQNDKAPLVNLNATHLLTLDVISLQVLKKFNFEKG